MARKILGVIIGVVTDVTISLLLGIIFGIGIAIFLAVRGVNPNDLGPQITSLLKEPYMKLANAGLGCFGSLVGGFVTGWIARTNRVLCGAIMGLGSVVISIPFWNQEPLWFNVLGIVLTLAMATCGAWLAEAVFGRRSLPPPQ